MPECDICGGPSINGAILERTDNKSWRISANYTPAKTRACRSCAKELTK